MPESETRYSGARLPAAGFRLRSILFSLGLPLLCALPVILFYKEENWRGKRAWENVKGEMKAKGHDVSWEHCIPPVVASNENFFAAPHMQDWFVGRGSNALSGRLSYDQFNLWIQAENSCTIAGVTIVPPDTIVASNDADVVLRLSRPAFFPPTVPEVLHAAASSATIPLIVMDEVPLRDAIKNLAQQAQIKYRFDPAIHLGKPDANGKEMPEPTVSVRWKNLSATAALANILAVHQLVLIPNYQTGTALVTKRTDIQSGSDLGDVIQKNFCPAYSISTAPEKALRAVVSNTVLPLIVMDNVPLRDAVRNLAFQAEINYEFDPAIQFGKGNPEPLVSFRWENVSAASAFANVLALYGLAWMPDDHTGAALITKRAEIKVASDAEEQLSTRINKLIAASTNQETSLQAAMGFNIAGHAIAAIKPLRIVVRSDHLITATDLEALFPNLNPNRSYLPTRFIPISETENNFRIVLTPPPAISASDYIAWSDQFKSDFDQIHDALQRPYAVMDGDYRNPIAIPIPNFVCVRALSQTLAQRAQCYLLLGQPQDALRELTLLHDVSRLLEARPTGKPMTLVAAMINVAITGLYVETIGQGLRLRAWRESDLAALQHQLGGIDLPPYVMHALECEAAGHGQMIDHMTGAQIADILDQQYRYSTPMDKWKDGTRWFLVMAPRGWLYQNIALCGRLLEGNLDSFDPAAHIVYPVRSDTAGKDADAALKQPNPANILARVMIPNFSRALQTMAQNQTLVNEASVACALERYRLANGHYPEILPGLTPQFADKIATDLIGGKPLIYRATNSTFTLSSIGWTTNNVNANYAGQSWPYSP